MVSWGIAFFEYCFQVPANRIGSYEFNGAQLKTIQEVITLSVFSVFSVLYLGEKFKWNYAAGFAFIVLGALSSFTSGKKAHLRFKQCAPDAKQLRPAFSQNGAAPFERAARFLMLLPSYSRSTRPPPPEAATADDGSPRE